MLSFEREAWAAGYRAVAGVDEAGRGPLAGPVVACAVLIEADYLQREERGLLRGLTDSKALSRVARERFFNILVEAPEVRFGLGRVEPDRIDAVNILRATHAAMREALAALHPPADHVLVDGLPVPDLPCSATALVGGDGRSLSIAAASVLAKVTRDRIMLDWDARYPHYGFARHKGYGTAEHLRALRTHGPCPAHRRSFQPVRQLELRLGVLE
jgi:ribonuclease HII